MKLYVDCDDVVTETARHLAGLRRREGAWAPAYEDIHDFDLHRSFRMDEATYRDFMERAHSDDELLALEAVPGACETLRAWRDDGLDPVIVTGRPAFSHAASREWLDRRGLADIPLLLVDKYNRTLGPTAEGVEVVPFRNLRGMGFDLAVDDAPPALDLLARSGLCPYVVFDRPWNRGYRPPADAVGGAGAPPHVRDWRELDALVRGRRSRR